MSSLSACLQKYKRTILGHFLCWIGWGRWGAQKLASSTSNIFRSVHRLPSSLLSLALSLSLSLCLSLSVCLSLALTPNVHSNLVQCNHHQRTNERTSTLPKIVSTLLPSSSSRSDQPSKQTNQPWIPTYIPTYLPTYLGTYTHLTIWPQFETSSSQRNIFDCVVIASISSRQVDDFKRTSGSRMQKHTFRNQNGKTVFLPSFLPVLPLSGTLKAPSLVLLLLLLLLHYTTPLIKNSMTNSRQHLPRQKGFWHLNENDKFRMQIVNESNLPSSLKNLNLIVPLELKGINASCL